MLSPQVVKSLTAATPGIAPRRDEASKIRNEKILRSACGGTQNDICPLVTSGAEPQVLSAFLFQFQQRISISFEDRQAVVADVSSLLFSQTLAA